MPVHESKSKVKFDFNRVFYWFNSFVYLLATILRNTEFLLLSNKTNTWKWDWWGSRCHYQHIQLETLDHFNRCWSVVHCKMIPSNLITSLFKYIFIHFHFINTCMPTTQQSVPLLNKAFAGALVMKPPIYLCACVFTIPNVLALPVFFGMLFL